MYQPEAKFDRVDPKATPEQVAQAVSAMSDKMNGELQRLSKSVNPTGRSVTLSVRDADNKIIQLRFVNGLLQ